VGSFPAGTFADRQVSFAQAGDGSDDFADRRPPSRPQVADTPLQSRGQGLDGQHVGPRKVGDVNEVSHAGAVPGRVVGAVDFCQVTGLQPAQRYVWSARTE